MTTENISSSQPTKGRRRNSSSASNTATETFANAAANFFLGADIADTTAIGGGTPAPSTDIWTIFVGEDGYEEIFIGKA